VEAADEAPARAAPDDGERAGPACGGGLWLRKPCGSIKASFACCRSLATAFLKERSNWYLSANRLTGRATGGSITMLVFPLLHSFGCEA
jgi:hypothetical protein